MTQKELRKVARVHLAEFLAGTRPDSGAAMVALGVLNAPVLKGE